MHLPFDFHRWLNLLVRVAGHLVFHLPQMPQLRPGRPAQVPFLCTALRAQLQLCQTFQA
jgi:hypothetical protein